ncbi:UNVERIFIED_CONTAM: hypothetical protein Sradi_2375200 [Sesamum radiatum]|uniref:Uncharacterized protein n=1 Tax=Sesamum radiatum TaxID=300843 RepID=A0AAW2T6H1_SESRA
MKLNLEGRSKTFQIEDLEKRASRVLWRLALSTAAVFRRQKTKGLVLGLEQSWQSRAYEDCILDLVRSGSVVRHGHHKPYPVQLEYVARTVDSRKESILCQHLTVRSLRALRCFRLFKSMAIAIDRVGRDFLQ